MKHNNIVKTFKIAAIAVIALVMAPAAKAQATGCTNAMLRGTFVYTLAGVLVDPALAGQWAEVGTQTFDGRGGTTATAFASHNGNIQKLTITGTYKVNEDCTGTFTLWSPLSV